VPTGDGTGEPITTWSDNILIGIQGLYVVTDMYPFHRQARKVDESLHSQLLEIYASYLAEYLDHGLPHFTFHLAFRIRFPGCAGKVSLPTLCYYPFLITIGISVGDGRTGSVPCIAHLFFSLSPSLDVRREYSSSLRLAAL
jgi:hypothetical protein